MKTKIPNNLSNQLRIIDLGLTDYETVLQKQHQFRNQRRNNRIPDTILILEHQPVITLGAHQSKNRLLVSTQQLSNQNIQLVKIRRGGGATAHNPGQLVFYPILNLHHYKLGVSDYIHRLEKIGQQLLYQLGVTTASKKGFPGLWVGPRKIASIGVRVSKFITYHGMAINIINNLSIFDNFVPCGLDNVNMTSAACETGKKFDMSQVKQKLSDILRRELNPNLKEH